MRIWEKIRSAPESGAQELVATYSERLAFRPCSDAKAVRKAIDRPPGEGCVKIPVVFAFDENYALPASVAIRSLIEAKAGGTSYEIIVLHGGLSARTMRRFEALSPIRWLRVDRRRFAGYPCGWSGEATWYRLLLADLLPEYDKVIWSDVDVLFRCDLAQVFGIEIGGADWAGVPDRLLADGTPSFLPGFMVVNTRQWRTKRFLSQCEELVRRDANSLTMFDLDVLNRVATGIMPLDPQWCVFERLLTEGERAPEFERLAEVHGRKAIDAAIANPKIIHYAGPPMKVWLRRLTEMPPYYRAAITESPFWDRDRARGGWRMVFKMLGYMFAYGVTGSIRYRRLAGVCRRSI